MCRCRRIVTPRGSLLMPSQSARAGAGLGEGHGPDFERGIGWALHRPGAPAGANPDVPVSDNVFGSATFSETPAVAALHVNTRTRPGNGGTGSWRHQQSSPAPRIK